MKATIKLPVGTKLGTKDLRKLELKLREVMSSTTALAQPLDLEHEGKTYAGKVVRVTFPPAIEFTVHKVAAIEKAKEATSGKATPPKEGTKPAKSKVPTAAKGGSKTAKAKKQPK